MYRKLRAVTLAGLSATMLLLTASLAEAAPGSLDPTFGIGGIATPAAPTDYTYGVSGAALQADGKIITVASEQFLSGPGSFAVQRLNADGSFDAAFGLSGVAGAAIPGGISYPNAVAVTPGGKIVVAGYRSDSATVTKVVVVQFDSSGVLDPNFDGDGSNVCPGDGIVCTHIQSATGHSQARALTVQPDNKIVVAGSEYESPGYTQTGVARFTTTGALDTSFSGDGRAVVSMGPWGNWANSVVLQADGQVLVAGVSQGKGLSQAGVDSYVDALGFIRLSSTGVVDPTYHHVPGGYTGGPFTDGVMISPRTHWTYGAIYSASLQPDGKLVASGYANDQYPTAGHSSAIVVRLNTDGTLDPTFGTGGRSFIDVGPHQNGQHVLVDHAGRPVVAGYTDLNTTGQMMVTRLNSAGGIDATFNGIGSKVLDLPALGSVPAGLLQQSDQKLLVAGAAAGARMAVIRLLTAADPVTQVPEVSEVGETPFATISSPKAKSLKRSKFRVLSGTAGPAGSVRTVKIALQRIDTKALKKKRRCYWLQSTKAKFKSVKASKGKCIKPSYRTASGTDSWRYRVTRRLPKASYELTVRVQLLDGRSGLVTKKFELK